ncbi:MAG: PIN domain-containing protein [Lentimicrobiaceae bacterium]|nr:PIN domain-containing protein [Lentimicrobiaceae bacterium]
MKRYYIDTCVLKWLLEGNKRVKDVTYDIKYYQGDFAVSIEVLKEFANLLASGKLKMDYDDKKLISDLTSLGIEICHFEKKHLKSLFELPYFKQHADPTDRNIIAHAIADKRILISGDGNFALYEKHGLKFLEV